MDIQLWFKGHLRSQCRRRPQWKRIARSTAENVASEETFDNNKNMNVFCFPAFTGNDAKSKIN